MKYRNGTWITCRSSGDQFFIWITDDDGQVHYKGQRGTGVIHEDELEKEFDVHVVTAVKDPAPSALNTQIGGDHYKLTEVLKRWLTPEEFKGYMKGAAIAYLAREADKGGMQDIEKAAHTLAALVELK